MIEKIIQEIIRELGPTGILICGLYWVLGRYLKKMLTHIENINDEIRGIMMILDRKLPNRDGKN